MTNTWPQATYACMNYGDAAVPREIKNRSICISDDCGKILEILRL